MKKEIVTQKAPAAVGPYSQAIKFKGLIFCAGQIGVDPKTNQLVGDDIKSQTKRAFENLKGVLEAADADFSSVLKVNVYLKNMDDFSAMNKMYASYFTKPYPARATVEVVRLPKGALVEIECIAYTKNDDNNCCGGGECDGC